MACLNCASRVLRILLHTGPLPPLRPAQRRLPSLLAVPGPAATPQRPFYARLATHLTAAREQGTLATLAGELTDDDYVPFDYHLAGAIPAAIGADVQSGWPPPVPEAAHIEGEPDIELTSPHEEEGAVWWDGAEEKTVAAVAPEEKKKKKEAVFLKREGYWTLDGGEQTYSLTPKKNKGRRKREREERERLAAAAAALAPSEEKEIHPAVPAPPEEKGTHLAVSAPPEEKKAEDPVPAPAEEEKVDTAESIAVGGHQEAGISTDTIIPDLEGGTGTLSEKASKKAARKAARKSWEEKKAKREAKIALKEAKKQTRTEQRTTTESEAANITDGATGKSSGAHRYDQFFSDSPKATKGTPRDPRESKKRPRDRKSPAELPRVPEILTLQRERLLGAVRDVPEGINVPTATNNWNLKIPDQNPEPTRLQKFLATAPRSRIQPWMIYKARLQEKFKGQAWEPPKKLSPDAQEAIRVLRKNHPEFTTTMLADKFEVSGEAIRRILRSKWREREKTPEVAQEWAEKWAKRGQKVWQRWEEAGVVHTKKTKRERKAKAIEERVKIVKIPVIDPGDLSDRLL